MTLYPDPSSATTSRCQLGGIKSGKKIAFLKKQQTKTIEHKIYAFKLINLKMMSR